MKSENSPEMARFNVALKDVLSVSKDDLKRLLAKGKKKSASPNVVSSPHDNLLNR